MLEPIFDKDKKSTGAWAKLSNLNRNCPGCGKEIRRTDKDIEYSATKRGTHVFWHHGCTMKVWH